MTGTESVAAPWVVAFDPSDTRAEERVRVGAALDGHDAEALAGVVVLATCLRLELNARWFVSPADARAAIDTLVPR